MTRWYYSKIGNPLWEWAGGQSVLFDSPSLPQSSIPPMTDREWATLDADLAARNKRERKEQISTRS